MIVVIGLGAVVGAFLLAELIKGLFRFVEKRGWKIEDEVREALELGVQGAWDGIVRDLKKKAEDGKLTKQEKLDARELAKSLALQVAKGPALNALKALAPQALDSLISLIVQRRKAKKDKESE